MCGIVGVIAERNVASVLLDGLKKLEYRGYDSAGMCILGEEHAIQRVRALGKVRDLEAALEKNAIHGFCGIAHTRWATHGMPAERNAHPLMSGETLAVVHNGIIENHRELRDKLEKLNYTFESETDTETAAHLIHYHLSKTHDLLMAITHAAREMSGAFALAVISKDYPGKIGLVRQGCPLVVGIGLGERFIASDPLAFLPSAQRFISLEEGDTAVLTRDEINILDKDGQLVEREVQVSSWAGDAASKGSYRHFMLKEIHEQPEMIRKTLEGRLGKTHVLNEILGHQSQLLLEKTQTIQIVACGTSYHAGLVARYWFEELAGIPCQVEIASEFRYRKVVVQPNTLFITVSQSGETADTLAALRQAKSMGYLGFLAICNVPGSSLVRESEGILMTHAGVEIGVASTKAFTTQLTAFLMLAMLFAKVRSISDEHANQYAENITVLKKLPFVCQHILELDEKIQHIAQSFADKKHALFLGRGFHFPVALEGALKLKEISYIHAEAYPAGELKHGPLALVDKNMPVIAVAANDELLAKVKSNLEEVKARGGKLYVFTDESSSLEEDAMMQIIRLPKLDRLIAPIAYTIPLQLLAYHVAVLKGTDVDQPRNLAKSVTVE